jgi:hypothetical protein
MTIAKLPMAKELAEFDCSDGPINEALVRDLVGGGFLVQQRNIVLVDGTGAGKSHLAIAIARSRARVKPRGSERFERVDIIRGPVRIREPVRGPHRGQPLHRCSNRPHT